MRSGQPSYSPSSRARADSVSAFLWNNNRFADDSFIDCDLALPDNVFAPLTSMTTLYGVAEPAINGPHSHELASPCCRSDFGAPCLTYVGASALPLGFSGSVYVAPPDPTPNTKRATIHQCRAGDAAPSRPQNSRDCTRTRLRAPASLPCECMRRTMQRSPSSCSPMMTRSCIASALLVFTASNGQRAGRGPLVHQRRPTVHRPPGGSVCPAVQDRHLHVGEAPGPCAGVCALTQLCCACVDDMHSARPLIPS